VLASIDKQATNRIIFGLILAALLGWGMWLRWRFIQTVHLYPDEFVTLLAIKMIAEHGRPVLPSGLFYEHGLLFSYLASLGWLVDSSYLTVRYVSLVCGGLTLLLTFWVGRRWFSLPVALMATSGLVVAPMAIQWSGRARMYALLQLLVLLSLWLAYTGIHQNRARLRWAALLVYLGATLTHFVAVTLAPALVVGAMVFSWLGRRTGEQGSRGDSRKLPAQVEMGRWGDGEMGGEKGRRQGLFGGLGTWWIELIALGLVLVIAFLVKRAGQPKGIEAWAASVANAAAGFWQVFDIYSNFSLNPVEGWQAIAPFYLVLPAALFTPFAVVAMATGMALLFQTLTGKRTMAAADNNRPALFLSLILFIVTLEMIFLVSPDRRDDKYLFMLLPALLLLGAQGMIITTNRFLITHQLPITNYQLPITNFLAVIISVLTLFSTWPRVQALLANTGDDYAAAFAYVRDHWQEGIRF